MELPLAPTYELICIYIYIIYRERDILDQMWMPMPPPRHIYIYIYIYIHIDELRCGGHWQSRHEYESYICRCWMYHKHIYIYMHIYICYTYKKYIYIYTPWLDLKKHRGIPHLSLYTYIYIYIYICVCVSKWHGHPHLS